MKHKKKLIIWDFDGTLADTFPVTFEAINDGLELVGGRRWTKPEIMRYFGRPDDEIMRDMVGTRDFERAWTRMLQGYTERITEVRVYPGIIETLELLSEAGHVHAVLTGRGRESTELLMTGLRLLTRFSTLVTGNDVTKVKPDPEGILAICKEVGIGPEQTLMVGDTPADILAGQAAGAFTVACTWDALIDREKLALAGPALSVAMPHEIVRALSVTG